MDKKCVYCFEVITKPIQLRRIEMIDGTIALHHCFYTKCWTHGSSAMIGGFSAGMESQEMAIIELEDGTVKDVLAKDIIRFIDKPNVIDEENEE